MNRTVKRTSIPSPCNYTRRAVEADHKRHRTTHDTGRELRGNDEDGWILIVTPANQLSRMCSKLQGSSNYLISPQYCPMRLSSMSPVQLRLYLLL
jgi:hypothetical protein